MVVVVDLITTAFLLPALVGVLLVRCRRRWLTLLGLLLLQATAAVAIVMGFSELHTGSTGPARAAQVTGSQDGLDAATSPTGAFSYTVPIETPGFHGMEPDLSLDYDSSAGNGEVGVGWRLSVEAGIARRGPGGGLPGFDSRDTYHLNGDELVSCAPSCHTGGTHETRQQSFERITFDGTTWTRWQRNGVRLTYRSFAPGHEPDTRWLLTRAVDTHSNTVNYEWSCPAGHCRLSEINYAPLESTCGAAGQRPCTLGAQIVFHHEARPDWVPYQSQEQTLAIDSRLKSIVVKMDDQLVTAYALGYNLNKATGRSVLRSVQQFPTDASVSESGTVTAGTTAPLPPTTFTTASSTSPEPTWAVGTVPLPDTTMSSPTPLLGNPDFPVASLSVGGDTLARRRPVDVEEQYSLLLGARPLYGDFDGDRRVDIAAWDTSEMPGCSALNVRLATGAAISTPGAACGVTGHVADLDGDRDDDILTMAADGTPARVMSDGNGTFRAQPALPPAPWQGHLDDLACTSLDANGDQLGDLACGYRIGGERHLSVARSTPQGATVFTDQVLPAGLRWSTGAFFASGDVDNSTTDDIMFAQRDTVTRKLTLVTGLTWSNGSVRSWSSQPTDWTIDDVYAWTFTATDADGDGRADFALFADDKYPATSSTVLLALSERGAPSRLVPQPVITATGHKVALGDANGDGRADIFTGDPAGVQLSRGDGTFAAGTPVSGQSTAGCGDHNADGLSRSAAADVNGDGQADLLCAGAQFVEGSPRDRIVIVVEGRPTSVVRPTEQRWRPFDHNGDGRQDLYAVRFLNPGYQVYTRTARQDGGFSAEHPVSVLPPGDGPALDVPDAGAWFAMDVTGPQGTPDGRSDLVLPGRAGSALQMTTLLSTGTGWTRVDCESPTCVAGAETPGGDHLSDWRPAQLNGDGHGDLVRFVHREAGVELQYLLGQSDGSWLAGRGEHFTAAGDSTPFTGSDTHNFRTVDLNLDGIDDYLHVAIEGSKPRTAYRVRSLISSGPTTWKEQEWDQSIAEQHLATAHGLQPIDIDGDGVTDLGRAVPGGNCIRVEGYIRRGAGWMASSWGDTAPCGPEVNLEDRGNLILTDVNSDGRADVVHLSRVGLGAQAANSVATLINMGTWSEKWRRSASEPTLAVRHADTWAWTVMDTDSDGTGELAHMNANSMSVLRRGVSDDRITTVDNGRGATTSISYRPQPGARRYLPSGMLPVVVDRITVTDAAYSPAAKATATFEYNGAMWSHRYRQMLGYQTIRSRQGETVRVTGNELSDACGIRPTSVATEDADGKAIVTVSTTYLPAGGTSPFTCLPASSTTVECEGSSQCRQVDKAFTHDGYGNVETVEESGDDLRRRTYTPVLPNTDSYIVDRPYKHEISSSTSAAPDAEWRLEGRTLYSYDDAADGKPGAEGDLVRVAAVSDLVTGHAAVTTYRYDSFGNVVTTSGPTGATTTTTYDPARGLFPVSTCTAAAGCTATGWNEALGVVDTATDVNKQVTRTRYDTYRRVVASLRPDGTATRTQYLAPGVFTGPLGARQRVRVETSDGSAGDAVHWQEALVDGLGRVYQTRSEGATSGPGEVILTDTTYVGASSLPAAVSLPHREDQTTPLWNRYQYDAALRRTAVTYPGPGNVGTSRILRVGEVEERDEYGHGSITRVDAFGRVESVEERVRPCPLCGPITHRTRYTYDAQDNVVKIIDAAGNVTTVVRDGLGRETSITDPDRGTRTLVWDDAGSLTQESDGNGTHVWTYDDAGRPKTKVDSKAGTVSRTTWTYDRPDPGGYDQGLSRGRLVQIAYSTHRGATRTLQGDDRFWYDSLGRITRTQRLLERSVHAMSFSYDPAGRLADVLYPSTANSAAEHVPYSYDGAGNLISVGRYLTDAKYNASGQAITQRYGNGLVEQRAYNAERGWIDSQRLTTGSDQSLFAGTYQHDATARVRTQTVANSANPSTATTQSFDYDDLGRLVSDSVAGTPKKTYQYDALGNLRHSSTNGTHRYEDPSHVHAATGTDAGHQRSYDAAGNLTTLVDPAPAARSLDISWTATGMPATIASGNTATAYDYGAGNERVKVTTADEVTRYFGRYLEESSTRGVTRRYWAGDQLLATRNGAGPVTYFLQDRQHSTRVATDSSGEVLARYNYGAYGAQEATNPVDANRRRWQGSNAEADSGLIYLNARYYDPVLAQFTAADSIIPDLDDPQTANRYAYAGNDPINKWDPSGHMSMAAERRQLNAERKAAWSGVLNGGFGCNVFESCISRAAANTIDVTYTLYSSGKFVEKARASGGVDLDGNWQFASELAGVTWASPSPQRTPVPVRTSAPAQPAASPAEVGTPLSEPPLSEPPLVEANMESPPAPTKKPAKAERKKVDPSVTPPQEAAAEATERAAPSTFRLVWTREVTESRVAENVELYHPRVPPLWNLAAMTTFDSDFHAARETFDFRGMSMRGWEVNYYFIAMAFAHQGYSWENASRVIRLWNTVQDIIPGIGGGDMTPQMWFAAQQGFNDERRRHP